MSTCHAGSVWNGGRRRLAGLWQRAGWASRSWCAAACREYFQAVSPALWSWRGVRHAARWCTGPAFARVRCGCPQRADGRVRRQSMESCGCSPPKRPRRYIPGLRRPAAARAMKQCVCIWTAADETSRPEARQHSDKPEISHDTDARRRGTSDMRGTTMKGLQGKVAVVTGGVRASGRRSPSGSAKRASTSRSTTSAARKAPRRPRSRSNTAWTSA